MGLAAPRKKTKISHDPNNTNWTRSTSGFGHKILSSQGWTPGSFLGARNAAHAELFTSASASHIRVIVKDDTLGLGARSKRGPLDEPTGLDAFKGLLGRLNGKSDAELQADQRKRDDVKLARYAATKWHTVRFVSGGLLAQEKDDKLDLNDAQRRLADGQESPRRAPEKDSEEAGLTDDDNLKEGEIAETQNVSHVEISTSRERREKKDKDKKPKKDKNEKKEKKDRKRKRTEQLEDSSKSSSQEQSLELDAQQSSKEQDQLSSDTGSLARERRPLGRHMIRGRHIAQKKRALMDEKSLNEIFMIKS